jgi:hypothetical protein
MEVLRKFTTKKQNHWDEKQGIRGGFGNELREEVSLGFLKKVRKSHTVKAA